LISIKKSGPDGDETKANKVGDPVWLEQLHDKRTKV
jgi:hypothetical protein